MEEHHEDKPFEYRGYIDPDLTRPLLFLGCERIPFLIVIGVSVFLTVVAFGLTPWGIGCGVVLAATGIAALRRYAQYDPQFFAMYWEALKYPRHIPETEVEPWVRDLPFIGYDDPPTRAQVIKAWLIVIGAGVATLSGLGLLGLLVWWMFF